MLTLESPDACEETDTVQAAESYIEIGWRIVPVPKGEKNPNYPEWPTSVFPAKAVSGHNVGLILGSVSNGLTDVDLDCPHALRLAPEFLPCTLTFGRASKPRSHWLFTCAGARYRRLTTAGDGLIELRADKADGGPGHQSVVPPSVHTSGEQIEFTDDGAELLEISYSDLLWRVHKLAIAAIVLSIWDESRHEKAKGITGGLLKAGLEPAEAEHLMHAVFRAAGFPEGTSEWRDWAQDVKTTITAYLADRPHTGFPQLIEEGLIDAKVAERLDKYAKAGVQILGTKALGASGTRDLPAEAQGPRFLPAILVGEHGFYVRETHGPHYPFRATSRNLRGLALEIHGHDIAEIFADSRSATICDEAFLAKGAATYRSVEMRYTSTSNTFDVETHTLRLGLNVPTIEARRDEATARWLSALCGDQISDVERWIANARPDRLTDPDRALVVLGPTNVGKSLIAAVLAHTIRKTPVDGCKAVQKHNAALLDCPYVLFDEQFPRDMTGADIRTFIAQRAHAVEPKGREVIIVRGTVRAVLAAQNLAKLGPLAKDIDREDAEAIEDRLLLVHVPEGRAQECIASLAAMQMPGGGVDLDRMAGHFLWLMSHVEPRSDHAGGKFARLEVHSARGVLAETHAQRYETVLTRIRDGERDDGVIRANGRAFVHPLTVAQRVYGPDRAEDRVKDVHEAIRPFRVGGRTSAHVDGVKVQGLYRIDAGALTQALRDTE